MCVFVSVLVCVFSGGGWQYDGFIENHVATELADTWHRTYVDLCFGHCRLMAAETNATNSIDAMEYMISFTLFDVLIVVWAKLKIKK